VDLLLGAIFCGWLLPGLAGAPTTQFIGNFGISSLPAGMAKHGR
jgi:hypothetical protein